MKLPINFLPSLNETKEAFKIITSKYFWDDFKEFYSIESIVNKVNKFLEGLK